MSQQTKPSVAALIPAAGSGERLGKGPKAYLPLGETSILRLCLSAFEMQLSEIVVAVSKDMLPEAQRHVPEDAQVILGGATRQASVYALLHATNADIVLIHDAARPFLAQAIIERTVASVQTSGAATVVKPVADTLIHTETHQLVPREPLRAVQTPQGFKRELIFEAHRDALANDVKATDDAALVRRLGHKVALVEGSSWLMKITTPADYTMAQALVGAWREQG